MNSSANHLDRSVWFEPSSVSVNLIRSMAVTRDLKAREISFRLEGFPRERKRDLKTTFKLGNPGQLIKLVNFFVAAGILMQAGDISLNPGPVNHAKRPLCSLCLKTIGRNQGEASCQAYNGLFHLKCIRISFEDSKCCKSCSEGEVVVNEQVSESENTAYPKLKSLSELLLSKGLKVCHQNIRSLLPKIDQVRALLEPHKGINILGVTESHLSNNVSDTEITIDGYKLYRKDRQSNHRGGGVLVYLADSLSALRREDLEKPELEAIWIELIQPHSSKGILLGTLYRPPDGSDFLDAEFTSSFENVLEVANAEKKEVNIMGDLNCNFSPGARCQGEAKKLKSILQSMNMTQVVNEPTRITRESQTLIDIICTSQPQNITLVKVVKSALSDHDMTLNHER